MGRMHKAGNVEFESNQSKCPVGLDPVGRSWGRRTLSLRGIYPVDTAITSEPGGASLRLIGVCNCLPDAMDECRLKWQGLKITQETWPSGLRRQSQDMVFIWFERAWVRFPSFSFFGRQCRDLFCLFFGCGKEDRGNVVQL